MPQLDFSTYFSQIFWLFVTFTLLYYVMLRHILPTMRDTFNDRKQRIENDLHQAKELKSEAENVNINYEDALKIAKEKAAIILRDADVQMKEQLSKQEEKIEDSFERQLKDSENRILKYRQEMKDNLKLQVSEISCAVIEKLCGFKVTKSQVQKVIDDHQIELKN